MKDGLTALAACVGILLMVMIPVVPIVVVYFLVRWLA